MDSIKPDSIIWVKLGTLYGWWPAIYQPENFIPPVKTFPDLEILESRRPLEEDSITPEIEMPVPSTSSMTSSSTSSITLSFKSLLSTAYKPVVGYARFFDDDKFDVLAIRDLKDLKPYSCPDKLSIIRNGLKKFEPKKVYEKKKKGKKSKQVLEEEEKEKTKERNKGGMFDLRARLAQFYKDVELAEVMTDNSPKVGEILQLYEIEGESWPQDQVQEHDQDHNAAGNSPRENENPNAGSKKRKHPAVKSGKSGGAKKSKC